MAKIIIIPLKQCISIMFVKEEELVFPGKKMLNMSIIMFVRKEKLAHPGRRTEGEYLPGTSINMGSYAKTPHSTAEC